MIKLRRSNRYYSKGFRHYGLFFLMLFCSSAVYADITAYYYDQNGQSRQYFTGNIITRTDANIDFRWGGNAPVTGIGRDDFSVRWFGELEVPTTGSYQFQTRSDDGVRLWVNGNLSIDHWSDHGPSNRTSTAVTLNAGQRYPILMEFYERAGGAEARLRWSGPGISGFPAIPAVNLFPDSSGPALQSAQFDCNRDAITLQFDESLSQATAQNIANYAIDKGVTISSATLLSDSRTVELETVKHLGAFNYTITVNNVEDVSGNPITAGSQISGGISATGLQATFYDQNGQSGQYFTGNTVVQSVSEIDNNWGRNAPVAGIGRDNFSVRWQGLLAIPTTGNYTFRTRSDDGVRLWIDNNLVVSNWTNHGPRYDSSAAVSLTAGQLVDIRMEFYERGGGAVAELDWSGPGITMQTIAPQYFITECSVNPVAQWGMDEGFWNGTVGEVQDSSGNSFGGQAFNGATTTGSSCNYGIFDGTDDYVQIPHDDALNGLDGLSYMAWVRANSWTGVDQIMAKSVHGGGSGRAQMGVFSEGGVLKVRIETQGGRREITSALPLVAGDWNHVAAVFDGESLRLYIDGVEQASSLFSATSLRQTSDPLNISKRVGTNTYYFHGLMDDVRVYTQALSQQEIADIIAATTTCAIVPNLHHFDIDTGSATASTCEAKQIAITACANAACDNISEDYVGTVNITTSSNHGDWSKNAADGVLNPDPDTDDDGSATYTFVSSDDGVIVLDLDNHHADNLTLTVNDSSASVSDTSSAIQFGDNVFVVTPDNTTWVAGRPLPMVATLHTRDSNGNCSVAADYENTKNLKAWIVRDGDDPGGAAPTIDNVALPGNASTGFDFDFTGGVANFALVSSDVGKYQINLLDDSGLYADGIDINSDAATLTLRPFGFDVRAVGNPSGHSGTDSDASFIAAGDDFEVSVRAVLWEIADDADGDGSPEYHSDDIAGNNVDLTNNYTAVSFGQEGVAENIQLTAYLVAPTGGNSVLLSGSTVNSFSAGSGSSTDISYSEVGIIEIKAALSDADYMASSVNVIGSSGYVGRFYPSEFVVTPISLSNRTDVDTQSACSSPFTFLDEELQLSFDIDAHNADGNITQNYTGGFAKLNTVVDLGDDTGIVSGSLNLVARHNLLAYHVDNRLSATASVITFVNGEAAGQTIDLSMSRVNSGGLIPEVPFSGIEFAINPIDSDGVESSGTFTADMSGGSEDFTRLDQTDLYFGRLVVENAYGSELRPLPMWAHTEYCTAVNGAECSQWTDLSRTVSDDSCTQLNLNPLNPPTDTVVVDYWQGSTNYGAESDVFFYAVDVDQNRGGGGWRMRYTGSDADAQVIMPVLVGTQTVENYHPYLLLQQGEASFGSYRGHDRIIYWREVVD